MSQLVLGLGHKARHGKDSFARAVEDYYKGLNAASKAHLGPGYHITTVQRLAFAAPLRKETADWLGMQEGQEWLTGAPRVYVTDYDGGHLQVPEWVKPDPKAEITEDMPYGKHSKLLQWWGTEYRRNLFGKDYWVNKFLESVNVSADIVIVTDMRFLNEVAAIKRLGGVTVNVVRRNLDGTLFQDPSRPADHPSETELDGLNYDFRIEHKQGDHAWLGEQAITLAIYLRRTGR